jgi:hypothetical protein
MKEANPPNKVHKHSLLKMFADEARAVELAVLENIHEHEPWEAKADQLLRHRWQLIHNPTYHRHQVKVVAL